MTNLKKSDQVWPPMQTFVLICLVLSLYLIGLVAATSSEIDTENGASNQQVHNEAELSKRLPPNHRMEEREEQSSAPRSSRSRQSRDYEGSMSASGSGGYASLSPEGAAYMAAQVPLNGVNSALGSSSTGYASSPDHLAGAYHSPNYHDTYNMAARNYQQANYGAPLHQHHLPAASYPAPLPPNPLMGGPLGSILGPMGGPLLPLSAKGFDVAEIVCSAIAVAIGAVIVGAPFILLYLFVMNQMGGMGGSGSGASAGGGAISLTGPTSSTTVNGRKKRHTSLPEALFRQLSPLVNSEQVTQTFKTLMNSLAKYQM